MRSLTRSCVGLESAASTDGRCRVPFRQAMAKGGGRDGHGGDHDGGHDHGGNHDGVRPTMVRLILAHWDGFGTTARSPTAPRAGSDPAPDLQPLAGGASIRAATERVGAVTVGGKTLVDDVIALAMTLKEHLCGADDVRRRVPLQERRNAEFVDVDHLGQCRSRRWTARSTSAALEHRLCRVPWPPRRRRRLWRAPGPGPADVGDVGDGGVIRTPSAPSHCPSARRSRSPAPARNRTCWAAGWRRG
jgi:hypothetical protein